MLVTSESFSGTEAGTRSRLEDFLALEHRLFPFVNLKTPSQLLSASALRFADLSLAT